ncbi:hypothetical protein GCM10022215_19110 [Nocardioides fonticola]|uniref:Uncharacterized protein n=1 Tax=Nocardioides fonticola TaxID=450363 RepID=A0ABP7XKL0_9ACTN
MVERAVGGARTVGDGGDGDGGEAAVLEQGRGGVEHALGRLLAAGLLGTAHAHTLGAAALPVLEDSL